VQTRVKVEHPFRMIPLLPLLNLWMARKQLMGMGELPYNTEN